jgi:hypothetical protein
MSYSPVPRSPALDPRRPATMAVRCVLSDAQSSWPSLAPDGRHAVLDEGVATGARNQADRRHLPEAWKKPSAVLRTGWGGIQPGTSSAQEEVSPGGRGQGRAVSRCASQGAVDLAQVGPGRQRGGPCPSVDWVGGEAFFCESQGRGSGWQFARNCLKPNVQSRKRFARSPGKHPRRCFPWYAYFSPWLLRSLQPTHTVWFILPAFAFGKPLKAETNTPLRVLCVRVQ